MRSINLPRRQGWIGGVCAGIADRLGIDPIIVRGIAVVIAVLGGPAFLLYAAAWLLLPDTDDRIHLERLIAGEVDRAIAGIAALVVLSLLPFAQGFWFLGSAYWGQWYWPNSAGRVVWTIVLLAAAVVATVWVARRASRSESPTVVPATTDARPETVPEPPSASGAAAFAAASSMSSVAEPGSTPPVPDDSENRAVVPVGSEASAAAPSTSSGSETAPVPPPAPAADAPPEDLAAWREQQDRWKTEHAAWKQQQAASARELRDQRAAETHARALANSAAAEERRRLHRLANPRVSAAAVFSVLGAAIVAGGIAALAIPDSDYGFTVGWAVAAIVFGLAIIVCGALRRRSGILGFFALVSIVVMLGSATVPPGRTLLFADAHLTTHIDNEVAQPAGRTEIYVSATTPSGTVTDLWQGAGSIHVDVDENAAARIEIVSRSGRVSATTFDSEGEYVGRKIAVSQWGQEFRSEFSVGPKDADAPLIRIWQGAGSINIHDMNKTATEGSTK
jgi:phage shock protein PspC (stress-responsive transcriptional regulator)